MRWKNKNGLFGLDKNLWAVIILCVLGGTFAYSQGWLAGTPLGDMGDSLREAPEGVLGDPVDLSQYIYHTLDEGAAANTYIRVYDGDMNFVEQTQSSSGTVTFKNRFYEGETLHLQARVAAPGSSGAVTYVTPLTTFVVPVGDADGDSKLPSWGLTEVATSAVTFVATDQAGGGISGTATNYLNVTDTALILTITVGVDDTAYGTPADFTDTVTTYMYKAGFSIVLNFNCTQDLLGATYSFSEGDNYYYVFNFPMLIDDASDASTGTQAYTINCASTFNNGGGAGANATLGIDIYDGCKLLAGGGVDSNSFFNYDSDLDPTAIATLVHE